MEAAGLQEGTPVELRAQAVNDRGASAWSGPLRVLTRRRAVGGGCDMGTYKWNQTLSEITIQLAVRVSATQIYNDYLRVCPKQVLPLLYAHTHGVPVANMQKACRLARQASECVVLAGSKDGDRAGREGEPEGAAEL